MSFPRYPAYKDSGVEWLGEVPGHWDVSRLSYVADVLAGHSFDAALFGFDGLPVIRMSDFGDGLVQLNDVKRVDPSHVPERSLAKRGDVLLGLSGSISNFAIVGSKDLPIAINQRVAMVRLHDKDSNIVQWFLQSAEFSNQLVSVLPETTIQNISMGQLRSCSLPNPPVPEQTQIAAFLDRETAKIDALVAEQRRLMALLKEKRQAVISHAVTRGLNPQAPLKPSGIEWLGDVPEHWRVTRLAYHATIENGTTPSRDNPDYWTGGVVPWLSSGEVNQYRITEAQEFISQIALDSCSLRLLPVGTIVVGMIGQGKTRGLSASLEIEACINQNLAAIVPSTTLVSDYLLYIFQSVYEYLREFGRGGNQSALNCEILSALKIPVPPIDEQVAICDYVLTRLAEFDTLTTEAQRAIDLLQERRTALISAAVTGQIDVRGAVQ